MRSIRCAKDATNRQIDGPSQLPYRDRQAGLELGVVLLSRNFESRCAHSWLRPETASFNHEPTTILSVQHEFRFKYCRNRRFRFHKVAVPIPGELGHADRGLPQRKPRRFMHRAVVIAVTGTNYRLRKQVAPARVRMSRTKFVLWPLSHVGASRCSDCD